MSVFDNGAWRMLRAFYNLTDNSQPGTIMNSTTNSITNSIRVRVPATTANLGPGFDTLGLALQVHNFVSLQQSPSGIDEIIARGEGASTLVAAHPENNIALIAARALLDMVDAPRVPLQLTLENAIPLARGLGSSSAARMGALFAANEWARQNLGKSVETSTLLNLATQLEGHPDNVAPALLGGLVVAAATEKSKQSDHGDSTQQRVLALRVPVESFPRLVVFVPESELETREARAVLPDVVFRKNATFNIARASLLVGVLASGAWQEQPELLREALKDELHQEHRAVLMPAYECATHAAISNGALGATLSGAGPSILAWLPDHDEVVAEVCLAMQEAAANCEVFGNAREVLVDLQGCVVIEGENGPGA
jgi:homoserine kinase